MDRESNELKEEKSHLSTLEVALKIEQFLKELEDQGVQCGAINNALWLAFQAKVGPRNFAAELKYRCPGIAQP